MLEKIKKFWNNDMHVVFTEAGAEISGINKTKSLPGIVCISDDKKAIVLSVGDIYQGPKPFVQVEFLPLKATYTELEYGCFQTYLMHMMSDIGVSFIRPRCFITLTDGSLSPSQKKFLDELFKSVKALEVYFWDASKRTFLPK